MEAEFIVKLGNSYYNIVSIKAVQLLADCVLIHTAGWQFTVTDATEAEIAYLREVMELRVALSADTTEQIKRALAEQAQS